ncbi:hypothetical protein [Nannocystis sp.]|uniref:hypothetical protein n=1 Tax=Nannocystis sp. TaxID=1962667 RepID=UPI0025DDEEDF|nr:hypothetical protein [Nannocystis sp.]
MQRGLEASEAGGEVGVIGGEAGEGFADAAGRCGSAAGRCAPGEAREVVALRRLGRSIGAGDLEAQLELADRDDQTIVERHRAPTSDAARADEEPVGRPQIAQAQRLAVAADLGVPGRDERER